MTMVDVASGSLRADSQPRSFGLVLGSAAAWRVVHILRVNQVNSRSGFELR